MPHAVPVRSTSGDNLHDGWSRRRLVAILVAAGLAATVLAAAFGYGVYCAITPRSGPTRTESTAANDAHLDPESIGAPGPRRRDAIAAAPMLAVPPSAAHPPADAEALTNTGSTITGANSIEIPAGDAVPGPALVMSGFPHTPQGAIAQLAQIDVSVLQSMSLTAAREVHAAWALPGGARPEAWWITASVRAFLDAASMAAGKDPAVWVQVEPAAALVKGTNGPDWTAVCVLLQVNAIYRSEGEVAFGHCERMQWVGGRWMIAPGAPPAPAPSTWPGTPLAWQAGWERWATVASPPGASESAPQHEPDREPEALSTSIEAIHDEAGAVGTAAELARSQIGFDYVQADAIATAYAAPGQASHDASRARAAVRARRSAAGLGPSDEPRAPASFAVTPLAYAATPLAPDRYVVQLLSWITLTTTDAQIRDHLQVDTYLLAWSDDTSSGERIDSSTSGSDDESDEPSSRAAGWRISTPRPDEATELTAQHPPIPNPADLGDLQTGTTGWTSLEDVTTWD